MPSAEIITIGTELLLGEIVDTNSATLARKLRDIGVDVFRTATVGDNTQRIAEAVREAVQRTNIVITTGGLGPTVDDPTRDGIALAMGVKTEFHTELWEQITERMGRYGRTPTDNQKRQAFIPRGAIAVKNPVGTAPAFIVEYEDRVIIALPGVPREMEYLTDNTVLPYLRGRYQLTGTIKARVLHTSGVGESQIDEWISDLEVYANPTVGLAAHAGQVDVRITAKANSVEEADQMIASLEQTLRGRLGKSVFGADDDTLEGVTLGLIAERGWTLTVLEVGLRGALIERMAKTQSTAFVGGEALPALGDATTLIEATRAEMLSRAASTALAMALRPGLNQQDIDIIVITPKTEINHQRSYGGHPRNAPQWAVNIALDLLRLSVGE
jgi:nicotinamide-nucleotide amidase